MCGLWSGCLSGGPAPLPRQGGFSEAETVQSGDTGAGYWVERGSDFQRRMEEHQKGVEGTALGAGGEARLQPRAGEPLQGEKGERQTQGPWV